MSEQFDFRKKFTENAKEFDALMTLMLAENKRLNDDVKNNEARLTHNEKECRCTPVYIGRTHSGCDIVRCSKCNIITVSL